ncbi:MAG: type I-E CRISPR-associated protein Cas5/CasD [Bifidobacteriaceae bacterium]|jgi:CRISPR system Cascade subunit CasD|nr:type I-E CRISPR-associated protein Cas5/CasD [Bifidobacteriaceae bacterium]
MSTLLLKLAGPMQSWGASSKFTERQTRPEPTKSGVIGLLAAAQGRRRTDPIEDLAAIWFGVRMDQPGSLLRDFHTAHNSEGAAMPLSVRYYLMDAVFLVGIETNAALAESLAETLRRPAFPAFLGRRSCPPASPLVVGLFPDRGLSEALRAAPWQASEWYRRRARGAPVQRLELARDRLPDDPPGMPTELVQDVPVSFSPVRRQYGWRAVVREPDVAVSNDLYSGPEAPAPDAGAHDPFAVLEGGR